jgi:hypothetical protein
LAADKLLTCSKDHLDNHNFVGATAYVPMGSTGRKSIPHGPLGQCTLSPYILMDSIPCSISRPIDLLFFHNNCWTSKSRGICVMQHLPQSGGAMGAEGYTATGSFAGSMDGGRMGDTLYALGGHVSPSKAHRRAARAWLRVRAWPGQSAAMKFAACPAVTCAAISR